MRTRASNRKGERVRNSHDTDTTTILFRLWLQPFWLPYIHAQFKLRAFFFSFAHFADLQLFILWSGCCCGCCCYWRDRRYRTEKRPHKHIQTVQMHLDEITIIFFFLFCALNSAARAICFISLWLWSNHSGAGSSCMWFALTMALCVRTLEIPTASWNHSRHFHALFLSLSLYSFFILSHSPLFHSLFLLSLSLICFSRMHK